MQDCRVMMAQCIRRWAALGGLPILVSGVLGQGCTPPPPPVQVVVSPAPSPDPDASVPRELTNEEWLAQSWDAYKRQFIQTDGRVVDREADDRTVSEGQAYAMLRAVIMDDPDTFERTLEWAEVNLVRNTPEGDRLDHLWAWKWGKDDQGNWGIQDANFASDADIDAVTALILAARQWNRPDYLDLASVKLIDLWNASTVTVPRPEAGVAGEIRYLLPGPPSAFQPQPELLYLNPSYLAPAAFRLFAQIDPDRDWLSLVDSSYQILEESVTLSSAGLPGDWIALDTSTGEFYPIEEPRLRSVYSFDAYRVWWRVTLDAVWFDEPRAIAYLQSQLDFLADQWRSQSMIPARLDLQGKPLVEYESTAQYGMLYAAFRVTDPAIADQMRSEKLLPKYSNGFWDNESAYYTQNLSWFGLHAPTALPEHLLQPSRSSAPTQNYP